MRVYYVTKKSLLKMLIIIVLITCAVFVTLPYKQAVLNVTKTDREIPIYNVETDEKHISLTFDCAWGADDIPRLVEILDKYNVKATFFMTGNWIDKYTDKVKLLSKHGHEIANHSDNHKDMTGMDKEKIKKEIKNVNKKIKNITGENNNLFRVPYGAYDTNLIKIVRSMEQYVIQWDIDSLDWKELGVDPIVKRVNNRIKKGSIILMHNDTKYTLQALPMIIEKLQDRGFKFVKVSDLILTENYYVDYKGIQRKLENDTNDND